MINSIKIENFRGFKNQNIEFRNLNIAIGKNNAGKTTLIEALRIISLITRKYKTANFKQCPSWLDIPKRHFGIKPSLKDIDLSFDNITYAYSDEPAKIIIMFENNCKIVLHFKNKDQFHAVLFFEDGTICNNSNRTDLILPEINILPQISPLQKTEEILNEDYVKNNIDYSLSSRHFRNQLIYFEEQYDTFKFLVESTWPEIAIQDFNKGNKIQGINPQLFIREDIFTTEIGYMGHGLQMWLQTMWFLARCKETSTVILDEPDVYMHADLQRKLIRLLTNKYKQVILTTHSVEIISEVEPENILIIDKKKHKSSFASNLTAIQSEIFNLGSIQNIALTRLWSSKKLLIVEGKDIGILKRIQNTLFPKSNEPFDTIPSLSIGGWGGWNHAIGSNFILKNSGNESINVYCIFDSDYHSKKEIEERLKKAKSQGIIIKIWKKKEIENYLISPTAIQRLIEKKTNTEIELSIIQNEIDKIADSLKDEYKYALIDKINTEAKINGDQIQASTAARRADEQIEKDWKDKLSVLSGKTLISRISKWTQDSYKVSINSASLAQTLIQSEIPTELKNFVEKIENNHS